MRRELARREIPKQKSQLTKQFSLSDASRIKEQKANEKMMSDLYKHGKVEGMEAMYSLTMQACEKVRGIGKKRKQALKEEICNLIMKIGEGAMRSGA